MRASVAPDAREVHHAGDRLVGIDASGLRLPVVALALTRLDRGDASDGQAGEHEHILPARPHELLGDGTPEASPGVGLHLAEDRLADGVMRAS